MQSCYSQLLILFATVDPTDLLHMEVVQMKVVDVLCNPCDEYHTAAYLKRYLCERDSYFYSWCNLQKLLGLSSLCYLAEWVAQQIVWKSYRW